MTSNKLALIRQIQNRSQRGYLMVELALVLAVSTILAASQISQVTNALDTSLSVATGQYLVALQSGINKYVLNNQSDLAISTPIAGFANELQPTIPELTTGGYLSTGFSTKSPLGLSFINLLAQANCPGSNCTLSGWAYSSQPYKDATGKLRLDLLGQVISTIGIDGSMSNTSTPNKLNGYGGGAIVNNPAGSVAGTVAINIGSTSGISSLLTQYYKLDGSRPLAGTMDANNNDIINLKNVTATGTTNTTNLTVTGDAILSSAAAGSACTPAQTGSVRDNSTQAGLVVCVNNVWQTVGNAVAGIANGGACAGSGKIGTDATGIAYICNGSFWTPAQTFANLGDPCAPSGKTAQSIGTSEQLFCKNGLFIKSVSLVSKNVEVSRQLVTDGQVVTKPTCDMGGVPAYSLVMTQTVVDIGIIPPRQAMYLATVDNGATWSVLIRVRDNAAGDFSGNLYSLTAILKLECQY